MTTTMAMVYENVENYGAKSLHDKEILIALTGIKEDIAKDMLNEYGSLMRVCENVPYFKSKLTKRQYQKLSLLNEVVRRNPLTIRILK